MFGIYLTYALYFVQPESYVAQVRVTPDQMADLSDFVRERLIPERHIDAFAALLKLINGGAFRIYAFEKEVIFLGNLFYCLKCENLNLIP